MSKIILSKIPTRPPKNADKKTIKKKTEELAEKIEEYQSILASPKKQYGLIKKELLEVKKRFDTPRRTEIIEAFECQPLKFVACLSRGRFALPRAGERA